MTPKKKTPTKGKRHATATKAVRHKARSARAATDRARPDDEASEDDGATDDGAGESEETSAPVASLEPAGVPSDRGVPDTHTAPNVNAALEAIERARTPGATDQALGRTASDASLEGSSRAPSADVPRFQRTMPLPAPTAPTDMPDEGDGDGDVRALNWRDKAKLRKELGLSSEESITPEQAAEYRARKGGGKAMRTTRAPVARELTGGDVQQARGAQRTQVDAVHAARLTAAQDAARLEQAAKQLSGVFHASFRFASRFMARRRGAHWLFPDGELRELGEAYGQAFAPHMEQFAKYSPVALAAGGTYMLIQEAMDVDTLIAAGQRQRVMPSEEQLARHGRSDDQQ